MATRSMTKKGALQVSQAMDRLASLFQQDHAVMGVSPRIAEDFALRLDQMSDLVERNAGVVREEWISTDGFDPQEVGKLAPGALAHDEDELYVRDNFTQQETRELSNKQTTGQLPYADVLPEQDMMGKLASDRVIDYILPQRKLLVLEDMVDEQTWDLAVEVWSHLAKSLSLSRGEMEALSRLQNSLEHGGGWKSDMHRNNIFKAANSMGIRLPSGMFS